MRGIGISLSQWKNKIIFFGLRFHIGSLNVQVGSRILAILAYEKLIHYRMLPARSEVTSSVFAVVGVSTKQDMEFSGYVNMWLVEC